MAAPVRVPWWRREATQPHVPTAEEIAAGAERIAREDRLASADDLWKELDRVSRIADETTTRLAKVEQELSEQGEPERHISDDHLIRWSLLSFHWDFVALNKLEVSAGTLRIHATADPVEIAGDTITLTGAECWVFVEWPKNTPSSAAFNTSTNEPKTEGTTFRVPLFYLTAVAANHYQMTRDCRFDINFGAPMT